jgi:hypothetical protein
MPIRVRIQVRERFPPATREYQGQDEADWGAPGMEEVRCERCPTVTPRGLDEHPKLHHPNGHQPVSFLSLLPIPFSLRACAFAQ